MLKKSFSQSQVPQMGTLKVTSQAAKTKFPHHYSSFSLLPTFSSSIPAALGCLSHWPLSRHFSLSPRLNYFFKLFAWQMTQVGIFRTCLVTSQHSSCSHVLLVWLGPFSFEKCKYLWPRPLMHSGLHTVRVSQQPKPGLHIVDLTQQSLRVRCRSPSH